MGNWPGDFVAAFSTHNVDEVLSYFSDDILYEEVVADGVVAHGRQELRDRIQGIFDAFPNIKLDLISHFSSGEHDCVEWISSGTAADSAGLPATGKSYSLRAVWVVEMHEGKINRLASYYDALSFLQQIGLMPEAAIAGS